MTDSEFTAQVTAAIENSITPHAAALAVFSLCCLKAKAEGMNPDIECAIHAPGEPRHHDATGAWSVTFEAGPHDWAVDASINVGNSKVYAEPYYGFDLSFYPA